MASLKLWHDCDITHYVLYGNSTLIERLRVVKTYISANMNVTRRILCLDKLLYFWHPLTIDFRSLRNILESSITWENNMAIAQLIA